jgi:hypothetical protein
MAGVFFEVFAKIGPSAPNTNHYSLPVLADQTDEELDGSFASGAREVVDFYFGVSTSWSLSRSSPECRSERERGRRSA